MLSKSLSQWAELLGGQLLPGTNPDFVPTGAVISTQAAGPSDLFVALTGGKRDGHDFVEGANWVLVEREVERHGILVPDTLQALAKLGSIHRESLHQVIGFTGSMGKTTTRRFVESIFVEAHGRDQVLATQGNLNNHLGVPLTLCRLTGERFGVIEMGANRQGEIEDLCRISRPNIAGITLAARAHVEGFGGLAGVVKGKGEIIDAVGPQGTVVLNADDAAFTTWLTRAGSREVISFGRDSKALVYASNIQGARFVLNFSGESVPVELKFDADYQLTNALCAAALSIAAGIDLETVKAGLESLLPEAGRGGRRMLVNGLSLIDDSYNANPDAMKAALDDLAKQPGRKIALLGRMLELGSESTDAHREVGRYARDIGVELATTDARYGEGFGAAAVVFERIEDAQQWLAAQKGPGVVLAKASRGSAIERCFTDLIKDGN